MRLKEVWRVGYERQLIEITLRAGENVTKRFKLLTGTQEAATRRAVEQAEEDTMVQRAPFLTFQAGGELMYRIICVLILIWGIDCNRNEGTPDTPDLGMPDLSMPDLSMPDLSMPGPTKLCSVDNWCWENPLPQGISLTGLGVWGADANNVWAVGEIGTILKWNGTTWAPQKSGTTNDLWGVWGADANNVWAVGAYGTILKWNGGAWARQNSGTINHLRGVWGSDANNVWAVGEIGTIGSSKIGGPSVAAL